MVGFVVIYFWVLHKYKKKLEKRKKAEK